MSFTTLGLQDFQELIAAQYAQAAQLPANVGAGASLGASFNAVSLAMVLLQNELVYIDQAMRLSTIPALPNGQPNPDVDTFCDPWAVERLGPSPSSGQETFTLPSPAVTQQLVPVGTVVTPPGGPQFTVVADTSNVNYNVGLNAYPIAIGDTFTDATIECNVAGSIGNVAAGSIDAVYSGPNGQPLPVQFTVTNALEFDNAIDDESDAAYKARFTLTVSSGRVATGNAILAAVAAIESNIIYSLGDQIHKNSSSWPGAFTVIVNVANQNAGPPSTLLTAATAAVESVRSAGISYEVDGPTLVPINASATILWQPGYGSTSDFNALVALYDSFVNGTGLNLDTTPTRVSLARCYTALLGLLVNGVLIVYDVQNLLLNGSAADVTANFGNQLVAGTATFT